MNGDYHEECVTLGEPHCDSTKELDVPPRRHMCTNFHRLNMLQLAMVKVDSKVKGNLTLHSLPKIDELYVKLNGAK